MAGGRAAAGSGDESSPSESGRKVRGGKRSSTLPTPLRKGSRVDSSLGAAKKTMSKLLGKKFAKE